ncbi:hypothetical protein HS088_TW02G00463 [Tripterygium wilfordii]|uniref:Uncharacterized protein n=1 Tax=Tripterygium wilfordii TaxID=458696 RepID=A0A7J7DYU7_TRIWF|nr:hypothetical protein HS088_TW02G00463 [Tripterygium wilfordii]
MAGAEPKPDWMDSDDNVRESKPNQMNPQLKCESDGCNHRMGNDRPPCLPENSTVINLGPEGNRLLVQALLKKKKSPTPWKWIMMMKCNTSMEIWNHLKRVSILFYMTGNQSPTIARWWSRNSRLKQNQLGGFII